MNLENETTNFPDKEDVIIKFIDESSKFSFEDYSNYLLQSNNINVKPSLSINKDVVVNLKPIKDKIN